MSEKKEELPPVKPDSEEMEQREPAVAGIQPHNEIVPAVDLESENVNVNNAVADDTALVLDSIDQALRAMNNLSQTAATIPALAEIAALNRANMREEDLIIEDLENFLAGEAGLPQRVESPNIESLEDVDEIDMMGELGLVRREDGERIEQAREEVKLLTEMLDKEKK